MEKADVNFYFGFQIISNIDKIYLKQIQNIQLVSSKKSNKINNITDFLIILYNQQYIYTKIILLKIEAFLLQLKKSVKLTITNNNNRINRKEISAYINKYTHESIEQYGLFALIILAIKITSSNQFIT